MWNDYELEILYKDKYLVVVNKPTALLVHKSPIDSKEIYFAMKILRDQIEQWVYPIHRLDKPTSGVLVFALDSETAYLMNEQFKSKNIIKKYIAIVRGYTDDNGFIDYALSVKLDKIADKQSNPLKEPQVAQTAYKTLAKLELDKAVGKYDRTRYSLVELSPQTGRKHQLRRHMKHISHHILGDTKYGRGEHNKMVREHYNCHRLMLHAYSLECIHPYTKEVLVFKASVDETWKFFLNLFDYHLDV